MESSAIDNIPRPQPGIGTTIAREPSQARGQMRVETILNAAAAIIAKMGPSGVTMHALSRVAQSSVGSMYHFFPTRESVLDALYERHTAAMRALTHQVRDVPASEWKRLSAVDVIQKMSTPFIEYMHQHPDFWPLSLGRVPDDGDVDFMLTFKTILDARLPQLTEEARAGYAEMMQAIAAGTSQVGFHRAPEKRLFYEREIGRALSAYLMAIEQDGSPQQPLSDNAAAVSHQQPAW